MMCETRISKVRTGQAIYIDKKAEYPWCPPLSGRLSIVYYEFLQLNETISRERYEQ